MKKFHINKRIEIGQVIPIVVLMLFVIIGMVALSLDGGGSMSNRRTAQAAADAGALAGAQCACYGLPDPKGTAESYATNNGATTAEATVSGKEVTVIAAVENPSFFAKIFGEQTLLASAEATAGCYGVKGKGAVPLAWRCPPPDGSGPFNPDYGCKMQTLDWEEIEPLLKGQVADLDIPEWNGNPQGTFHMSGTNIIDNDGIPPNQIYVVINEDKICFEDSGNPDDIICDWDGDGKREIKMGGDRGWLYLTKDTSNIGDWVDDGPHPESFLQPHVWLSGKSGDVASVYNKMKNNGYEGEVVLIPVFNVLCDGDPRTTIDPHTGLLCVDAAHAPPWSYGEDDFSEMKNANPKYHIIAFAPFYISCVDNQGDCPGYTYAQRNVTHFDISPVLEGFFLSNYTVSIDINQVCDINLGNCILSLSD